LANNISKVKRAKMLKLLDKIKSEHNDDETLMAINQIENELTKRKYGLVWEEHRETVDQELQNKIPVFQEHPDKNIETDSEGNYNFLIEGDNLHSLYLIEKTHKESFDCILIDPPYNTGKDFIYNDGYVDKEDDFKHSKWLSFMSKRLNIAKTVLKDDGFIAINIDENEYASLKLLCDEVFGKENHLSTQHIQVRYTNKSLNEHNDWQPVMEYVLLYEKKYNYFRADRPKETYGIDKFQFEIKELTEGEKFQANGRDVTVFKKGEWEISKKTPDIDRLKEAWISGSIYSDTGHGTMYKRVVEPRVETDGLSSLYKIEGIGEDGLGYRYYTNPKRKNATRGKMFTGVPLERRKEIETGESVKEFPIVNYYDYSAEFGNIRHEGGVPFNKGKKPIDLLKQILSYHKNKDIKVLDFFAGSGSTAHAVLDLNKKDGGNRQFVICTNNENNICEEVTYQRLKNIKNDYNYNLKYYKTGFINRNLQSENKYISDELLMHIKELIQLENHINLDNECYVLVTNENELINLFEQKELIEKCKTLYKPSYVFLSTNELKIINENNINIVSIPEYYFAYELKEAGEV